jgi:hypothetical protein
LRAQKSSALAVLIALILPAVAGCKTFSITVAENRPRHEQWTAVVFPFSDARASYETVDLSVYGYTGEKGSGLAVARHFSRAFQERETFRPVDDLAFRRLLIGERLSLSQLAGVEDARACELGRRLKADMVVRGEVLAYRTSWFLFVPRCKVLLDLRGLDPVSGAVLWKARVGDVSWVHGEGRIAADLARELAQKVQRDLGSPSGPGTK